jgi:hypothetical protein
LFSPKDNLAWAESIAKGSASATQADSGTADYTMHIKNFPVEIAPKRIISATFIPAHGRRRLQFTPQPSGLRFYHTHNRAGANLAAGQYSMHNASDDIHPIHLHRHSFGLTSIGGKPTAGIFKDVLMLGGYQEAEVDFMADNPGLTLFHCHQQLHMDFGFMTLFDYV